jgi:hypothetical protein
MALFRHSLQCVSIPAMHNTGRIFASKNNKMNPNFPTVTEYGKVKETEERNRSGSI